MNEDLANKIAAARARPTPFDNMLLDLIEILATELQTFTEVTDQALAGLTSRVTDLEAAVAKIQAGLVKPARYILTIDSPKDPHTMAFQIVDTDTSKVSSVSYVDALGFPTTDAGATVVFASSDATILTVDASSGAITPVAPGSAQVQATVTNTDGTAVTGVPADVQVIAGAAASFTVSVA